MIKRFIVTLLLCLMCCTFTGCGLIDFLGLGAIWSTAEDAIDEAKDDKENQEKENLMRNVTSNARSKSTDKAMENYKSKQKAANAAESSPLGWPIIRWIPWIGADAQNVAAQNAFDDFELEASTDVVYQDSLRNGVGDVTSFWDKFKAGGGIYFIVVIAAILAFLAFFGIRGKARAARYEAKAAAAEAKSEARIAAQEAKLEAKLAAQEARADIRSIGVENRTYTKALISDESYMRMIQENCAKTGMDAQRLIADNGGNLELAYQQSNLAAANKR